MNRQRGFTLIEMSFALVIIALLIAGVVAGLQIIENGKISKQISMVTQANTAINAFRLKYNCLPGDCANATSFFPGDAQPALTTNGNGDGKVEAYQFNPVLPVYHAAWIGDERRGSWEQLGRAGIMDITPSNDNNLQEFTMYSPQSPLATGNDPQGYPASSRLRKGMQFGWEASTDYISSGHKLVLGGNSILGISFHSPLMIMNSWGYSISIKDAFAVDTKIDDGKPFSGKVVAVGRFATHDINDQSVAAVVAENSRTLCGNIAENRYRVSDPAQRNGQDREYVCRLHIDTGM